MRRNEFKVCTPINAFMVSLAIIIGSLFYFIVLVPLGYKYIPHFDEVQIAMGSTLVLIVCLVICGFVVFVGGCVLFTLFGWSLIAYMYREPIVSVICPRYLPYVNSAYDTTQSSNGGNAV